ncbi:MAG: UvrD-helicase domain-containing protein, partial [Clostridia bacterium]|nr:UvrD-helicase domain-containing protein [Clostridia bacterium]
DLNERIKPTVGDFKKELKALSEIAADEQGQLALFTSTERATRAICLLTREFDECYSLIKREENLCDFSDLEHLVYKMLLSHPEIREELKSNYKYVFADEYQDVNGVQEKILSLIADGNLFMVGDVKQSIYAFRGCNPDIFAAKRERYNDGGEGETVNLDRNFRSGDGILKAVNNIFGRAITKEFGGVDYSAEYMTGGGLYPDGYGEATLHIIKKAKKEKRVYTGLYNPLKDLAATEDEDEEFLEGALTAQIIESEIGKEIIDPKSGEKREIKAGDIAVIVRSDMGYIHKTLRQLARRGIPATSEAEVNILDYPEIKIIISALKLIAYYADDVPLASTLKSAIGGLDERELAEIRRPYAHRSEKTFASCVSDYEREGEDESIREKLADFRQYLENIRLLTEFESAGEIIRRLLTERGLDLEIAAMPFGKARLERVERLIAETSPDGKNLSVNEFLERLKNSENKITLSAGAGDDCVKIMTIHASKGLEFPVVIIPRLGKQFKADGDNVYADREEGFATDAFDIAARKKTRTLRKKYFLTKNKMNAVKEEARIFYVAMTRAQSKLHLVSEKRVAAHAGEVSAVNATSFADFLCLEDMPCVYHEESSLTPPPLKAVGEVLIGEDKPSVTRAITRNITFEYPNEKDCALPLKKSVTDLTESRKIGGAAKAKKEESEENFITAEKGVAYHKFMETRDLNATSVKSEIERLVEEKILTKEQGEILDEKSLEKAISSPLFEELKGFKIYREQPFICHFEAGELSLGGEEGKVMVQGIIDLLAIKGDSAAIVDYKTSRLSCDALKEKYGGQLSLYAAAAEKVLKVKVVKKVILNLISGESIEV